MGQCPSREKYLEYFSKFEFLMFLMTQSGDLFADGGSIARVFRDIRGLPRDSLASKTSSREKHLGNCFSNYFSKVFGGLP